MQQGNNKIFFNPVFTLQQLQIIADQRAKELGVENTFQFTISHLSQIILHEINHIINHTELTLSNKTIEIDGKELNMLEYQQYLYDTFGPSFKEFENIFEDIDVNNHATKLQAPVFDIPKKEIYQHLCAPNSNFSKSPLHEQFTWTCLRESMINEEPCSIDEKVRKDINRIKES
ncbi:MAG: hypothetical protein LBI53_07580 [Candidatus Peribacteria bacterium]|jgi:hypothetical protein|nr:hypothetical protein [Candidatus Peribacteria bacterium]